MRQGRDISAFETRQKQKNPLSNFCLATKDKIWWLWLINVYWPELETRLMPGSRLSLLLPRHSSSSSSCKAYEPITPFCKKRRRKEMDYAFPPLLPCECSFCFLIFLRGKTRVSYFRSNLTPKKEFDIPLSSLPLLLVFRGRLEFAFP